MHANHYMDGGGVACVGTCLPLTPETFSSTLPSGRMMYSIVSRWPILGGRGRDQRMVEIHWAGIRGVT